MGFFSIHAQGFRQFHRAGDLFAKQPPLGLHLAGGHTIGDESAVAVAAFQQALAGEPLSKATARLPQAAYLTATEFVPWEAKGRVMRTLLEDHRDSNVDLVDGIKVLVDDGFVLVRPDPDEPACHIVASVSSAARARDLLDEYSRRVREARGGEGAPVATEIIGSASTSSHEVAVERSIDG